MVGTFQTTLIPSMVGRGGPTFNIEAVQTRGDMRGKGIGAAMFRFAVEWGREAGARLAQLIQQGKDGRAPVLRANI